MKVATVIGGEAQLLKAFGCGAANRSEPASQLFVASVFGQGRKKGAEVWVMSWVVVGAGPWGRSKSALPVGWPRVRGSGGWAWIAVACVRGPGLRGGRSDLEAVGQLGVVRCSPWLDALVDNGAQVRVVEPVRLGR